MVRSGLLAVLPVLLLAGGCLNKETDTRLVSADPFGTTAAIQRDAHGPVTPARLEVAARVDALGHKILAANRQAGVQPVFRTIGASQPEIFHVGTTEIDITEGLVEQCRTEGQLAAVLCHELGKMVAEREASATPATRYPDQRPPAEVRVGNDNAGTYGPADETHLAELGKYEEARRRHAAEPLPTPDPQALARIYLGNAQYSAAELEQITPLLNSAAANDTFEKQLAPPGQGQR